MKILELKGKRHEDFVNGVHGDMTLEEYLEMPFNETYVKSEGTGKSFALYSKTHKINDNVIANTALVLDVDKSPEPLFDALKTELERLGVDAVIGTTYSNDPDNGIHSLRAVIPFKTPVSKESFPDVGRNFVASSPYITELDNKGLLDHRMFVPSQYWLDPSVHPDRELTARKERTQGGAPLNPDIQKREKAKKVSSNDTLVKENIVEGQRNVILTSECGRLVSTLLNEKKVRKELHAINAMKCNPPLPHSEVETIFKSIWAKHFNDHPEDKAVSERKDRNHFVWEGIKDTRKKPPLDWLISKHILSKGVMFIYGASQAGKTFLGVDLVCSLALKQEWFGMPVKKNVPVRYVSFEDYEGVSMRLDAWRIKHDVDIDAMQEEIKQGGYGSDLILTGDESTDNFIQQLGDFKEGVIVIDTMNRVSGGEDENSSAKMGQLIRNAERIAQETNSLVILVHHTGKDLAKGLRGSTALHAGADVILEVEKTSGGHQKVTFVKIKNSKDGHHIDFGLETVYCDKEVYGDENESAVAYHKGEASHSKDIVKIQGSNQTTGYRLIKQYLNPFIHKEDDFQMVVNHIMREWVEKHTKKDGTPNDKLEWEVKERIIKPLRDKYRVIGTGTRNGRESRIWLIEDEKVKITY